MSLLAMVWGLGVAAVSAAAEEQGGTAGRWQEVGRESFDTLSFAQSPAWRPDAPDASSRYADNGEFFRGKQPSFAPPAAYRLSAPVGPGGFLTLESYSRTQKDPASLFALADDPSRSGNRVLRIASPEHTDGTLLCSTKPLGNRYKICARVGHMDFGTGDGLNGYEGGETSGPWLSGTATNENGFYFGAIYRSRPHPANNVLAHYERIAFIDSDNNTEGWTAIWDPTMRRFFRSGWHPIVMGAMDTAEPTEEANGHPFFTYAGGDWNQPGKVLAVDAYQDGTWYTVCFTRFDNRLSLSISGDFRQSGRTTYEAMLPDASSLHSFDAPHYWLLGDPHVNYYEGSLLVDDVVLSVWQSD